MSYKILAVLNALLLIFAAVTVYQYFNHPRGETFRGENWTARQFGDTYYLSIKNNQEIVSAITDFINARNITAGNISGIGAVKRVTLRFFDPKSKQYIDKTLHGQMEIANLTGNISTMGNEKIIHLHITLGDKDYVAHAGHLLQADLSGAGEFVIHVLPGGSLKKTADPATGLNLYDFSK